jgi:hypothetical protein
MAESSGLKPFPGGVFIFEDVVGLVVVRRCFLVVTFLVGFGPLFWF